MVARLLARGRVIKPLSASPPYDVKSTSPAAIGVRPQNVEYKGEVFRKAKMAPIEQVKVCPAPLASCPTFRSRGLMPIRKPPSPVPPQRKLTRSATPKVWRPVGVNSVADIDFPDDFFSGAETEACCRYFRPAWVVIGTFKAALHSFVSVEAQAGIMKWHQEVPSGGIRIMRILLSSLRNVIVSRSKNDETAQFMLVVDTSSKPSRLIFGFTKAGDARRMMDVLKSTHSY